MTITANDVDTFHDAGADHWWWMTPGGSLLIADQPWTEHTPVTGAVYLMPWDAVWFEQWSGDWQAAADQLNTIIQLNTQQED